jgi:predicted nucleotidyltransferase
MNLQNLKDLGLIIFECRSGSHAYNLNTPTSDVDTRGVFRLPAADYLRVSRVPEQVNDERHDTVYYDLKRYFQLAADGNPNIVELLWIDPADMTICAPVMREVIARRQMFISKKAYHTFSGYAYAQIKKARGQNKLVYNPEPQERPTQLDYCWVIPTPYPTAAGRMPGRPIPLRRFSEETGFDLGAHHAAKLEHVPGCYRLYFYGEGARGVFRGDGSSGLMLVCESIPIDEEWPRFRGILVFNEDEYAQGVKRWENYWTWMDTRNRQRWISQKAGEVDFDLKNMMHCMRLMMSCENILRHGQPIVRFEGEAREYLMGIRSGRFKYEELMGEVDRRMAVLETLYRESPLPYQVDTDQIDAVFRELIGGYPS